MSRRGVWAFALLAVVACTTGCGMLFYRGPRGIESAIERQIGCDLDRQFGFKLGAGTASIASGVLRAAADQEDDPLLDGLHLRGLGVAVFQVHGRGDKPVRLDARRLGYAGWDTVLRVKEDGDQLLLLSRPGDRGGIREAVLVSYDGEEVVVVRVKGQFDGLIRATADAATRDGQRESR